MLNDSATAPVPEPRSGFRNYWVASAVVIFLAALYVGWVFYSRWQASHALEEKAAARHRSDDGQIVQRMGGDRFEILGFYASPSSIAPGDTADLCYSLECSVLAVPLGPLSLARPSEKNPPRRGKATNYTPSF